MPFTAAVYTLGCKVNQYESEAICERLQLLQIQIKRELMHLRPILN